MTHPGSRRFTDYISDSGKTANELTSFSLGGISVTPEDFSGANDTERWQAAISWLASNGGGRVKAGKVHYDLTNLVVTDNWIELDFANSIISTDPTTSGSNGAPMIYAHGSALDKMTIVSVSADAFSVTVSGALAYPLLAGDLVEVGDLKFVPPWNYLLTPDHGTGYIGQSQMSRVISVVGSVVTLDTPTEWAYATTPYIRKINPLLGFKVYGIAELSEVDPGTPYVGDSGNPEAPHIISIQYADQPYVADFFATQFQLHAINVDHCTSPLVERLRATYPFRPEIGGHGYGVRFAYSRHGVVTSSTGYNVRHLVDDVQCLDTLSYANTSFDVVVSSYKTHGIGAKRFTSRDDAAYGFGNGWDFGNPQFSADYDSTVISPRGSPAVGFVFCCLADGLDIIDPKLDAASNRTVLMTSGAKNLLVSGGRIKSVAASIDGIFSRAKLNLSDTYSINPENIEIDGVSFVQPEDASTFYNAIEIDADGTVVVSNCVFDVIGDMSAAIVIGQNIVPNDVVISGNRIEGIGVSRFVLVGSAPIGRYLIANNRADDRNIRITPTAALILLQNIMGAGSTWTYDTVTIIDAVLAGAYVARNVPATGIERHANNTLIDAIYAGQSSVAGLSGTNRSYILGTSNDDNYSSAIARAIVRLTTAAESGGNTGSHFEISLRADNGSNLWSILFGNRTTGQVTINAGILQLAMTWDKSLLTGTSDYLWVNATTHKLMIKNGTAPANDADGTVIGPP